MGKGNCNNKKFLQLYKQNLKLRRKAKKSASGRKWLHKNPQCISCCFTGEFFSGDVSNSDWEKGNRNLWAVIDKFGPNNLGDQKKTICCLKTQNMHLRNLLLLNKNCELILEATTDSAITAKLKASQRRNEARNALFSVHPNIPLSDDECTDNFQTNLDDVYLDAWTEYTSKLSQIESDLQNELTAIPNTEEKFYVLPFYIGNKGAQTAGKNNNQPGSNPGSGNGYRLVIGNTRSYSNFNKSCILLGTNDLDIQNEDVKYKLLPDDKLHITLGMSFLKHVNKDNGKRNIFFCMGYVNPATLDANPGNIAVNRFLKVINWGETAFGFDIVESNNKYGYQMYGLTSNSSLPKNKTFPNLSLINQNKEEISSAGLSYCFLNSKLSNKEYKNLKYWQVNKIKNMTGMFYCAKNLKTTNSFRNWKLYNINKPVSGTKETLNSLDDMFRSCENLQNITFNKIIGLQNKKKQIIINDFAKDSNNLQKVQLKFFRKPKITDENFIPLPTVCNQKWGKNKNVEIFYYNTKTYVNNKNKQTLPWNCP